MPVKIEQLPGESIVVATPSRPFEPKQDMTAMFAELTRLRLSIGGPVALIVDSSGTPISFSQMVIVLSEASHAVKASKEAGGQPPITIFIGSGRLAELVSQAMGQRQYGGVSGHLCTTLDEALTLARKKLAAAGASGSK
jgi:hypothetical protein